jgi:hypothetical protein
MIDPKKSTPQQRFEAIALWHDEMGRRSIRRGDHFASHLDSAVASAYRHAIKIIGPKGHDEIPPECFRLLEESHESQ